MAWKQPIVAGGRAHGIQLLQRVVCSPLTRLSVVLLQVAKLQAEAERLIAEARAEAQKKVADAKAAVAAECAKELAEAKAVSCSGGRGRGQRAVYGRSCLPFPVCAG
jgi:hypothetical protein